MINHVTLVGTVKNLDNNIVTLEIENIKDKKIEYIPVYLESNLIKTAFDHIKTNNVIGIRGYVSEDNNQVFINAIRLSFISNDDE